MPSYFERTSISDMIARPKESPYGSNGRLIRRFSLLSDSTIDRLEEDSRASSMLFGQPSLVRYMFDQVRKGLTILEPELIPVVSSADGEELIEHILGEGGGIVTANGRLDQRGKRYLMSIGPNILEWDRLSPAGAVDTQGFGPMNVHQFETIEEASERFAVIKAAKDAVRDAHLTLHIASAL